MKTNKLITKHSESMLTVRMSRTIFKKITEVAKRLALSRSEYIRFIIKTNLDSQK
jgi:metal-responsive CopG/Arc/MetJ family transcriptional regulator